MTGLIDHFESALGPIRAGWTVDANGTRLPFQIARFEGGPIADMGTLVTLGYSDYRLRLAHSRIRQELMIFARPQWIPTNLPGILQQVALKAIDADLAIGVSEVLERRGELIPGTGMVALYAISPVYFPDAFHVFSSESHEDVFLIWLVPITRKEVEFVHAYGSEEFEAMLENVDPDLLDLSRESVV